MFSSFHYQPDQPSLPLNKSETKADLISSLGNLLTHGTSETVEASHDFGKFFCSVEDYEDFTIVQRNFESHGEALSIPFSSRDLSVQMIFSLNGKSAFNDRLDPFLLSSYSHCINFFEYYDCKNLLDGINRQHDITFRLKETFYHDLLVGNFTGGDKLSERILNRRQFNTINQHIAADAGIQGVLQNILSCPFQGGMRSAFIREHIRALLMLQLFHFNGVVTGMALRPSVKITRRDEEMLHAVKHYLDQHYLEATSLDAITRHFGLNAFKLKHGFKSLFETSPMRYLQQKRLAFSLALLRDTDKTIKEIADEIGYTHAANFTIAFTKTFGHSPLRYRAKKLESA